MKYCDKCVMPDTKPGVYLDDRGLCNACRSQEIKATIDWEDRLSQLKKIVDGIKKESHPFYDCIVPVSGGKDSWTQAIMLSEKFKPSPLSYSATIFSVLLLLLMIIEHQKRLRMMTKIGIMILISTRKMIVIQVHLSAHIALMSHTRIQIMMICSLIGILMAS